MYKPASLMMVVSDVRLLSPCVKRSVIFSSSSSLRVAVGSSSNALHTSAATNHGSPSRITVRTSPKVSFLNVVKSVMLFPPVFRE